jgi:hypothetical protein
MIGMSRTATCTLLTAVALMAVVGCSSKSVSPGKRTGAGASPTPSPTSYPIASLGASFTEFCLSFPHALKQDATSRLSLGLVGADSYAEQAPCDAGVAGVDRGALGHIRIVFEQTLSAEQQTQVDAAVSAAYPDASSVGQDLPGLAVAFTVTPKAGSALDRLGSFPSGAERVLGKVLVSFSQGRLDGGDTRVGYVGPLLTPDQVAQVQRAIATAAGVTPAAVRLLPFAPGQ